ncbi:MAG TPA: GIY-YIG nuclease family protein [Ignavibacteriaceae bacterium]|nr:GIY-YIG nuclease family protein [Ignavibacteriaceae bacterium]
MTIINVLLCIYILNNLIDSDRFYIGFTTNIKRRLKEHNDGLSKHTSKFRPWEVKTVITFNNKKKALEFEKYLKSHSGRAFAKKHF